MTPLPKSPMKLRPLSLLLMGALWTCVPLSSCATRMPVKERLRRLDVYTETSGQYLAMGEWERAQDQAMKGLALDDDHFLLRLYLGRALLHRGDIDSILKSVYTLEQLDADGDFRVPLSLGAALERQGLAYAEAADAVGSGDRYTGASDPAKRAEELRKDARKAFARSLKQFEKALELQPTDTEVMNGLVRITALRGEYEDSLAWCEAILSITNDDRAFWEESRSRTNISPQDERRMSKSISKLERLEMAIHLHAATILRGKLDRPEDALKQLDSIIAFDPKVPEIHSQRGQLLVELHRYEEAIASLDNFLRLTTEDFEHPDVKRAYRLRTDCETALARSGN